MATAEDIMDTTRSVYLNDINSTTYTNDRLIPILKTVYDQLQSALHENGIETGDRIKVQIVQANEVELYPLPNDYFLPSFLEERTPGSSDEYSPMYVYRSLPVVTKGHTLKFWTPMYDKIMLVGATADREVKIHYQGVFPAINVATDAIFGKAEQYLSAKLAAMAHMFITQSPTLAEVANQIAEGELAEIINMQVKKFQAVKTRPLPYSPFRSR